MLLLQPPRILHASTGHYPHLSSWETVQPATARVLWSTDKFPRRTHSAQQAVAMSCWPLLPQACPAFLPPTSLSEPEPLNQPLLSPPPVWVKNRRQRGTYMQRRGQNQSWTLGVMLAKKRKGNLSMKPQEQQIKSPQSTWCTLHLWNTWINNKSFQNWGSRLWEQL